LTFGEEMKTCHILGAICLLLVACESGGQKKEGDSTRKENGSVALSPAEALRSSGPIFTILHSPNGVTKESSDIFTDQELEQALLTAEYVGPYHLQLKQPLSEHYFRQDCIVVLESKSGIDLTVYEEQNGEEKKRFLLAYFMDGNGMHLYQIPDAEQAGDAKRD